MPVELELLDTLPMLSDVLDDHAPPHGAVSVVVAAATGLPQHPAHESPRLNSLAALHALHDLQELTHLGSAVVAIVIVMRFGPMVIVIALMTLDPDVPTFVVLVIDDGVDDHLSSIHTLEDGVRKMTPVLAIADGLEVHPDLDLAIAIRPDPA